VALISFRPTGSSARIYPMHQIKNLCMVLITSTLLVAGPVFGCCFGISNVTQSKASTSSHGTISRNTSATNQQLVLSALTTGHQTMENPCHGMDLEAGQSISINPAVQPDTDMAETDPAGKSSDCPNCTHITSNLVCSTTLSDTQGTSFTNYTYDESEFEALYFLVLLDFPADTSIHSREFKPPAIWLPATTTPVTLSQILTI